MKKIISLFMTLITLITCFVTPVFAGNTTTYGYDPEAAVAYAAENLYVGEDEIVCDQFVKLCLSAAGVDIQAGDVTPVRDALIDAGFGTYYPLTISSDGVHILQSDNPDITAGDVMFLYCNDCEDYVHTALISGYDENGYMTAYGHNSTWDNVSEFGYYGHTSDDGEKHEKCFTYYAVHMDTTRSTHQHSFTTNNYEAAHPHKMYAACSCGVQYYLGWNATVSSCTACNPPVSDTPVLTASLTDDNTIYLEWTPVEDVVNYTVWRSKSENGTYYQISTGTGVKITNTSVDPGTTYYYYVVANRTDEADSVVSNIVSCTTSGESSTYTDTPVLTASLTDDNTIYLEWTPVEDAVNYTLWRSKSENGTYFKISTNTGLKITNASVDPGTTYYYYVVANRANEEESVVSNIVSCRTIGDISSYKDNITLSYTSTTYTGSAKKPTVTIAGLTQGTDYTVSYSNNKAAGTATVTITGIGSYTGTATKTFTIKPIEAAKLTAALSYSKTTYTGKAQTPTVTVKNASGTKLTKNTDYTLSYNKTSRSAVGRYCITITYKGNYSGTQKLYYTIVPKAPTSTTVKLSGYDDVKITWNKSTGATGYYVYAKKASASKYSYLGKTTNLYYTASSLSDGVKYTFKIVPYYKSGTTLYAALTEKVTASIYTLKKVAAPTVTKYSSSKVKVKWTNIDGETGYQISVSTSKTGTSIVSTVTGSSASTKTLSVTKGKTYYYKVRAYKTVGSTKIYGPWSAVTKFKLS